MIDTLTIGIRFALYVNLMLLFGLPLFGLYGLKGAERLHGKVLPFRLLVGTLAATAIGLSALNILVMTASMAGVTLLDVDGASVKMMISDTPMGHAWQVRMAMLLIALIVAIVIGKGKTSKWLWSKWLWIASIVSAAALASLAWTGHGAASEGAAGSWHLIADIVHLLAAGAWIGALAALGALLFRHVNSMSEDYIQLTHRALDGFSVVGTVIVALIILSGLVNSLILVGPEHMLSMGTILYGQLLIAKLLLFGAMLSLAAANRFKLTPVLSMVMQSGDTSIAIRLLRRSLIAETSAALAILGFVAWLGTLEPPMSI